MMINIEHINEEEYKILLHYIGTDVLRDNLINIAPKLPTNNPYFMSKKRSGISWNGFSNPSKLAESRVLNFYLTCVYKNKTDCLIENFGNLLLKVIGFSEDELPSKLADLDSKVTLIITKLFNIDESKFNKDAIELKQKYDKIIFELQEQIAFLNNELEDEKIEKEKLLNEKNKYDKILEERNITIENLKNDNNKLNDLISKLYANIQKDSNNLDIINILNSLDIDQKLNNLKFTITNILNEILDLLGNNNYIEVNRRVISIYILVKMMEDGFNGR